MSDTKKTEKSTEVYGPSPVLSILDLQQEELQELLKDQENYPW